MEVDSASRSNGESSLPLPFRNSSSGRVGARDLQFVCSGRGQERSEIHQARAISAGLDQGLSRFSSIGSTMSSRSFIRLIFVSACLAGVAFGQSQPSFEAGAAQRVITPNPLLPLSGGMGPTSAAKGKQGE